MFDFILLFIVVLSVLLGILRGAIKEIFNLFALVLSILITLHHYDLFLILFQVERGPAVNIISAIGVFVVSFIIIMLINAWIVYSLTPIRLNIPDRFLGAFIGCAKGIFFGYALFVFINVFYYALYYNAEDQKKNKDDLYYYLPHWVKDSSAYSALIYLDENVNRAVPESVNENIKEFGESFSNKLKSDQKKAKSKQ